MDPGPDISSTVVHGEAEVERGAVQDVGDTLLVPRAAATAYASLVQLCGERSAGGEIPLTWGTEVTSGPYTTVARRTLTLHDLATPSSDRGGVAISLFPRPDAPTETPLIT